MVQPRTRPRSEHEMRLEGERFAGEGALVSSYADQKTVVRCLGSLRCALKGGEHADVVSHNTDWARRCMEFGLKQALIRCEELDLVSGARIDQTCHCQKPSLPEVVGEAHGSDDCRPK